MPSIDESASEIERIQADLAEYSIRQKVIQRLRSVADDHNSRGDAALRVHDYDTSTHHWSVAARCIRAAQSIGNSKPLNPRDYAVVRDAHRVACAPDGAQ